MGTPADCCKAAYGTGLNRLWCTSRRFRSGVFFGCHRSTVDSQKIHAQPSHFHVRCPVFGGTLCHVLFPELSIIGLCHAHRRCFVACSSLFAHGLTSISDAFMGVREGDVRTCSGFFRYSGRRKRLLGVCCRDDRAPYGADRCRCAPHRKSCFDAPVQSDRR